MTNPNPPTYQQFLDAARHLRDRKAYDAGLAALIGEGPKLDPSWSGESATDAMCRAAAWLAVAHWAQADQAPDGSPSPP